MNAIEAHHLSKEFDRPEGWRKLARAAPVTAVSDLSLTVPEGELFGLLGPNGAGKTTLVKMLCTLILPSSGSAIIAGHNLTEAGAIRAAVGLVVSDDRSFYWRISARRNLAFFAAMHGLYGRAAVERINQVLADVDLLDVAERRFGQFSSGMKQRLAIARGLLHQPHILFLDEPSRSLDPTATQRLHALIRRLMAERAMTVFLITHDLAEAETLCNRVAFMHKGQIQATGSPAALRRHFRAMGYSLHVEPLPEAALAALHNIPSLIYRTSDYAHRIEFQAMAGDGVLTAVLDTLHHYNITIHHIENTPPSLEELFHHFTKEAG
jgi:ABC-2 type transport system ATP-binding protein